MKFRPCIDLHGGIVKQIVGSTLENSLVENFKSDKPSKYYAELFRRDGLYGGHVIMLGPGNREAAVEALRSFPGGLQVGGGINSENAGEYLAEGADKVIVTSAVFHSGQIDWDELNRFKCKYGKEKLVLDLSCKKTDDGYRVATDRWSRLSPFTVSCELLEDLERYCSEFLIHAVDAEGKRNGIENGVAEIIASWDGATVTYAGGISHQTDIQKLYELTDGKADFTVGSALDIYGGALPYADMVKFSQMSSRY